MDACAQDFIGQKIPVSGCAPEVLVDGKCIASCVLDSTDEGAALAETVADLFALFSVGQLYTGLEYARCGAISGIISVSGPAHDPACVNGPGDIKSFLDFTSPSAIPSRSSRARRTPMAASTPTTSSASPRTRDRYGAGVHAVGNAYAQGRLCVPTTSSSGTDSTSGSESSAGEGEMMDVAVRAAVDLPLG